MTETPPPLDQVEPPRLKFLRWLVIGLTTTMILGLITIVTLIVMTFLRTGDRTASRDFTMPAQIELPDGEDLQAYTKGSDWGAIVTRDGDGTERIHILDSKTGAIRQSVEIR